MKFLSTVLRQLLFLTVLVSFVACRGEGGGGESTFPSVDDLNELPPNDLIENPLVEDAAPLIVGYAFELAEGDFWEYDWVMHGSSYAQGSSSTSYEYGAPFRITLGAPVLIEGVTAYPMIFSGQPHVFVHDRWTHIAMADNRIYGWKEGKNLTKLFDAQDGVLVGSGLFKTFGEYLHVVKTGGITTQFINIESPAHFVDVSSSEGECQYFPEIGETLCGGGMSVSYTKREYYQPDIGPAGYYYYNSYSSCGGGFCSGASDYEKVGLVASSRRGDVITRLLEQEPNNVPSTAQMLTLPATLHGGFYGESDYGPTEVIATMPPLAEQEPNDCVGVEGCMQEQVLAIPARVSGDVAAGIDTCQPVTDMFSPDPCVADWYRINPVTTQNVTVSLRFDGDIAADLDLFVLRTSDHTVVGYSADDSLASKSYEESITFFATGGASYYIGVAAYAPPNERIPYTLSVYSVCPIDVAPTDWYQFELNSQVQLKINWGMDGYNGYICQGIVLTDSAGAVVHQAKTNDMPTETDVLDPGIYRLGVYRWESAHGTYHLSLDQR